MDNNIESKIYNDLVSLKKDSINYSIVCQRVYYHLLEHYGNTLTETYMKSALIADKVETTLKNLTRTDIIKELTVYNLYTRISSIILENI